MSYATTYMQNLKNDTDEIIYKTEIDSQTENKLMVINGEISMVGEEDKLGVWDQHMNTTLYKINNKDLTVQHRELYSISCNNI